MDSQNIAQRFSYLKKFLDERQKRLYLAAEALTLGRGGITAASKASGVSRVTITSGCKELESGALEQESATGTVQRVRSVGGGRKKTLDTDPSLKIDLESLIEPATRGDPESPLRWTAKSVRNPSKELKARGHKTSHRMVAELLKEMGYSLLANRNTREGSSSPDRNEQFENIYKQMKRFQNAKEPVISVDTKK